MHLDNAQRWSHNCEQCVYIGSASGHDVYYCPGTLLGSWLSRFGSEESAYASYPMEVLTALYRNGGGQRRHSKQFDALITVMEGRV